MTALSFIRSDMGTLAILTTSSDNQGASSEIFVGPKRKLVGEKKIFQIILHIPSQMVVASSCRKFALAVSELLHTDIYN